MALDITKETLRDFIETIYSIIKVNRSLYLGKIQPSENLVYAQSDVGEWVEYPEESYLTFLNECSQSEYCCIDLKFAIDYFYFYEWKGTSALRANTIVLNISLQKSSSKDYDFRTAIPNLVLDVDWYSLDPLLKLQPNYYFTIKNTNNELEPKSPPCNFQTDIQKLIAKFDLEEGILSNSSLLSGRRARKNESILSGDLRDLVIDMRNQILSWGIPNNTSRIDRLRKSHKIKLQPSSTVTEFLDDILFFIDTLIVIPVSPSLEISFIFIDERLR